jgi:RNA polymerase sigma-70 factor, ECF subfamily
MLQPKIQPAELELLADDELVRLASKGEAAAVRTLVRRHNQRLYRVARSIVLDDSEAEDVVQETYVRAFTQIGSFRGESSFTTWLTRIAINEALGRLRRRRTTVPWEEAVEGEVEAQVIQFPGTREPENPERAMGGREIRALLERAIEKLPEGFRTVFVARLVEELSIEETAASLGLKPETVKTRLHRARALLRKELNDELEGLLCGTFPFAGHRCDRLTEAVLRRLAGRYS